MTAIEEKATLVRPPEPARGKKVASAALSSLVAEVAGMPGDDVLAKFSTSPNGLSEIEAQARVAQLGLNEMVHEQERGLITRFMHTLRNPLVILLSVLAVISFATGDIRSGVVMSLMVVLGVVLRFVQESRADSAAAKLKAMITVTATVVRDGQPREAPLNELVPGDIVSLSAQGMIPVAVRVLSSQDLFAGPSALTGESRP